MEKAVPKTLLRLIMGISVVLLLIALYLARQYLKSGREEEAGVIMESLEATMRTVWSFQAEAVGGGGG